MNKEIRKEIRREYYRALVEAKIAFAKEYNIVLELNAAGLVSSRYRNDIIGGIQYAIYNQNGSFNEFKVRFLKDLKQTKFWKEGRDNG